MQGQPVGWRAGVCWRAGAGGGQGGVAGRVGRQAGWDGGQDGRRGMDLQSKERPGVNIVM